MHRSRNANLDRCMRSSQRLSARLASRGFTELFVVISMSGMEQTILAVTVGIAEAAPHMTRRATSRAIACDKNTSTLFGAAPRRSRDHDSVTILDSVLPDSGPTSISCLLAVK